MKIKEFEKWLNKKLAINTKKSFRHRRKVLRFYEDKNGCWLCPNLYKTRDNYPRIRFKCKNQKLSRIIYVLINNISIDEITLNVLHSCDNPECVNPEHLSLGTHKENSQQAMERERFQTVLTKKQVREIKLSTKTVTFLAQKYGVKISVISHIKNGYSWTDNSCKIKKSKDGRCRLTEKQVKVIKHSNEPTAKLAKKYNVTYQNVRAIKLNQTWKHV